MINKGYSEDDTEISMVYGFQHASRGIPPAENKFNEELILQTNRHLEEELRETHSAWRDVVYALMDKEPEDRLLDCLEELADGYIDIIYVAAQGLFAMGFTVDEAQALFRKVHSEGNWSKLTECSACQGSGWHPDKTLDIVCPVCHGHQSWGARKNPQGKILKPDGWKPADLQPIVRLLIERANGGSSVRLRALDVPEDMRPPRG